MKKIYYIIALIAFVFSACSTDWGYIDTGVSKDHKEKTMYEYFQTDTYNWSLVKQMIDRAELSKMFKGEDLAHAKIMFLGPVDNIVRDWMWDNSYRSVDEIAPDLCKKIILRYVFDAVYEREAVPVKTSETGDGGLNLKAMANNPVWFYSTKDPFLENPNIMITTLYLLMKDNGQKAYIASSGINVKNGIVHSLDDSHKIGNIKNL